MRAVFYLQDVCSAQGSDEFHQLRFRPRSRFLFNDTFAGGAVDHRDRGLESNLAIGLCRCGSNLLDERSQAGFRHTVPQIAFCILTDRLLKLSMMRHR